MLGLGEIIKSSLEREVSYILRQFRIGVKKIFLGTAFLLIGFPFIALGLLMLFLALFFWLAHYANLTLPAIISGLVGIAVGILILLIGLIIARR